MLFLKVFREKDLGRELQQIYSFSNSDLDTFKLEAAMIKNYLINKSISKALII